MAVPGRTYVGLMSHMWRMSNKNLYLQKGGLDVHNKQAGPRKCTHHMHRKTAHDELLAGTVQRHLLLLGCP
eukprot:2756540-Karenia_brevis.AAC.1